MLSRSETRFTRERYTRGGGLSTRPLPGARWLVRDRQVLRPAIQGSKEQERWLRQFLDTLGSIPEVERLKKKLE